LRGTGTGIIEAKLAQQLAHLEQTPFFGVFINLRKASDAMDCGCCLEILALHGVGPKMLHLICNFWDLATNVCWAKGIYGQSFKAGRGVTQGGPLSAKLFNIVVDAVVQEWMWLMCAMIDDAKGDLAKCIAGIFAVFYIDDGYIASRNAEFLQEALDTLVETFKCVSLATSTKKTQAMNCMPGKIRIQLPTILTGACAKGWPQGRSCEGLWYAMYATRHCRQGAYARIFQAPMTSTNR
jgi:hypothetical protein